MTGNVQASLHGHRAFVTPDDILVGRTAIAAGGRDKPLIVLPGAPDTVAIFDDFLGDLVRDEWVIGGDTGQNFQSVVGTSVSGFTNGVYRMTSSASVTQTPAGASQSINTAPQWKANQGRLRFGVRLKTAVLAGNSVFAGFTDTGGNEIGAYDTGGGIQTPAGDYVGFIWSGEGGATQQTYRCVAGKAGTDQVATPAGTAITPTANVYDVLEVELPGVDGGAAHFYINGKPYATIASSAVTATTPLAAGVWRANTDAAADALDIDWINVSGARDTGT
jgi:hypothetical protein